MVKALKTELGECRFQDCIEGMQSLPSKSFELGFADPPFNINLENNVNSGVSFSNKYDGISYYEDNMGTDEYREWCVSWLSEMKRVCNKVLVYCGGMNLPLFYRIDTPLEQIVYYMKFNKIITSCSWTGRYKPILVYADDKNSFLGRPKDSNCKFDTNVIVKKEKWFDSTEKTERENLIHPCPIDRELIYTILLQMKPLTFLDIFVGSGITIETAEELEIKWLGFEINDSYIHDIETCINIGKEKHDEKHSRKSVMF